MNEALRLLAKLLRKHGYDIKCHYEYNLLPIANLESFSNVAPLYNRRNKQTDGQDADLDTVFICLRTCLRTDTGKTRPPEVTGGDHVELVLGCVNSLINSINHAARGDDQTTFNLIVFDDHSDSDHKKALEDVIAGAESKREIRTIRETGQGNSLFEQFEFARGINALCYFCEDDYLHEESAIAEMVRFYRQVYETCNTHLVIHPQEHEFLYTRYVYPSYLLLGENRHWRTISHATHTLFTHSSLVSDFWQYFKNTRYVGDKKKRRLGAESRTTNFLFDQVPGFAPIPSLAAHMQTSNSLPPFFNWRPLWEKNRRA